MRDNETIETGDISVNYTSFPNGNTDSRKTSCHDKYEIIYVTSGSGKYLIEGVEFPISARSLFLSRPFEYRTVILDTDVSYSRYVIKFSLSSLSEECGKMLLRALGGKGGVYYAPWAQHVAVDAIFDRFYIAESLTEGERSVFVATLLTELIILLCSTAGERLVHTEDSLVTKVTRYINSNLQRDLSLETLSRRFFVNKYYLCRAFKQQSGVSIHNYINQKRVLYAKQLIEAGEAASRAAYKVGFCDYSAFYRAYTKFHGVSPTSHQIKGVKDL